MVGGAADRSGLIHVGDEVIEVNNINVEGKTPGEVLSILVTIINLSCDVHRCFYNGISMSIFSKTVVELLHSSLFHRTANMVNEREKFV